MFTELTGSSDKQRCCVGRGMMACNLSFQMTMFSFHVCYFIPCLNAHANAQTIMHTCMHSLPMRIFQTGYLLKKRCMNVTHRWPCVERAFCFVFSDSANTSNLKLRCITCTCFGNNQNKTYPPSHFLLLCFGVEIMP